jgi:hypothetical protein
MNLVAAFFGRTQRSDVLDEQYFTGYFPQMRSREGDHSPILAKVAALQSTTERRHELTAQAWATAIEHLPNALRLKLHETRQELATIEQEIQRAHADLQSLRVPDDRAARQTWAVERAALQQQLAQLVALRPEQQAVFVQLCRTAAEYLRPFLQQQVAAAEQATQRAVAERAQILKQYTDAMHHAELVETTLHAVLSAVAHPHLVEAHLGYQVTPDPEDAVRAAVQLAHAERQRITGEMTSTS